MFPLKYHSLFNTALSVSREDSRYKCRQHNDPQPPDFRVLQTRLALLENKIEGVEADYGYGKIFAVHLQSDETPVCPMGTFKLWVGYSLVKAFVSLSFLFV